MAVSRATQGGASRNLTTCATRGENSGYHPDTDVELGFELWASMRYSFFKAQHANESSEDDPVAGMVYDVSEFGLHIAASCGPELRAAARARFGTCYLGCLH